ncbi:MAG: hypothetical protein Kow001_23040 [Acidobacteriota bacterium]
MRIHPDLQSSSLLPRPYKRTENEPIAIRNGLPSSKLLMRFVHGDDAAADCQQQEAGCVHEASRPQALSSDWEEPAQAETRRQAAQETALGLQSDRRREAKISRNFRSFGPITAWQ